MAPVRAYSFCPTLLSPYSLGSALLCLALSRYCTFPQTASIMLCPDPAFSPSIPMHFPLAKSMDYPLVSSERIDIEVLEAACILMDMRYGITQVNLHHHVAASIPPFVTPSSSQCNPHNYQDTDNVLVPSQSGRESAAVGSNVEQRIPENLTNVILSIVPRCGPQ